MAHADGSPAGEPSSRRVLPEPPAERLAVRVQLGSAEWTDAHDLMDLPLEQLEGATAGRGVRIAAGDALGFLPRSSADEVHPDLPVRRGTGQHNRAGLVLLLHPDEMLVQRDRPLVAG